MSSQLDILALEPFYGGVRKSMLETVMRCSRHRWTLLKLPPRRIERRLSAAAHWFAEQLSRHWAGRVDLLFTSEALNLADLLRLVPTLDHKPSVVYFHNNQLPDPDGPQITASHDLVNLNTAQAALELWFNSDFHLNLFAYRAAAMVERHAELSSRNPVPEMLAKSRVMPPPFDLHLASSIQMSNPIKRQARTIFVNTRDADMNLMNLGLTTLMMRGERFQLLTVGPLEKLVNTVVRTPISENDEYAQTAALLKADIFLSTQRWTPVDLLAVRALTAGCWPILPEDGVYTEIIPKQLRSRCLYDATADAMASRIQDVWHLHNEEDGAAEVAFLDAIKQFDAIVACKAIDERLTTLATKHPTGR
jgi:Domain of unknown function (DUF3524)